MLEKASDVTREGKYTHITYARWADDMVILVDGNIDLTHRQGLTGVPVKLTFGAFI